MRSLYITLLLTFEMIVLSSSCHSFSFDKKTRHEFTSLDCIWLPFARAMESKNIDFLIENSLDSISCYDCGIDSTNQQSYFDSEFIFKNHFSKVMHLSTLNDKAFTTYLLDDNNIRVVYNVKSFYAPEGAYGLFFTLVKKEMKYYFQGMMVQ